MLLHCHKSDKKIYKVAIIVRRNAMKIIGFKAFKTVYLRRYVYYSSY